MAKKHHHLGNLGAIASIACLIHCLALPLILPILPLLGMSFLSNKTAELWVTSTVLLLAGASLLIGFFKYHQKLFPIYLFGVSALLMVYSHSFGHDYEHWILGLGALSMVGAHIVNIKLCKTCPTCHEDELSVADTPHCHDDQCKHP